MPPHVWPTIIEKKDRKYKYPHKWSEVEYQDIIRNLLYYYWNFIRKEWHEKEKRKYRRLWYICDEWHPR